MCSQEDRAVLRTVDAVVQIGTVETPYVRAGQGPPLILLRESAAPLGDDPLFHQLATRFRVIVPIVECCSQAGSLDSWLRGLIDGLGLEQPRIIIAAANEQELSVMLERMRY